MMRHLYEGDPHTAKGPDPAQTRPRTTPLSLSSDCPYRASDLSRSVRLMPVGQHAPQPWRHAGQASSTRGEV